MFDFFLYTNKHLYSANQMSEMSLNEIYSEVT